MKLEPKEQIKTLLAQKAIKQKDLASKMSEMTGGNYNSKTFSAKLNRESFTYKEMLLIAEILGYDIQFVNNNNELI